MSLAILYFPFISFSFTFQSVFCNRIREKEVCSVVIVWWVFFISVYNLKDKSIVLEIPEWENRATELIKAHESCTDGQDM